MFSAHLWPDHRVGALARSDAPGEDGDDANCVNLLDHGQEGVELSQSSVGLNV
jgi:hypothetical protein